jgi:hypothetical protein
VPRSHFASIRLFLTALQPRSTKIRKGSRTIAGRSIGILGLASGAASDVLGETAPPHADHGSPASGARLRGRERPGNKIILLIETRSADVRDAAADCSPPSVTVAQPEASEFAHLAAHPRRIMKVTFRHKQNPSVRPARLSLQPSGDRRRIRRAWSPPEFWRRTVPREHHPGSSSLGAAFMPSRCAFDSMSAQAIR